MSPKVLNFSRKLAHFFLCRILTLPIAIFRLVHYEKLCQWALWCKLQTWEITLRIYSAVLHRLHFPLKHLHFSSPKLVLLQLAIKVKYTSLLALLLHIELKYFFLQKWHNKLTLTSVMAWWEKDNSDFPPKFAGSLKYGLRAQDHRLLLHRFQPKVSKLKSCQIHTIYLENVACTVHVTSWLIVFKPHFSNQVHKGVL